ncbi:MAG: twin-arginine translocase subunit TatC [Deltaproteobacteria bacterium]|nr:twin-arginine translocase subunit TatC [Deltaproteobacteria bacterium]
MGENLNEMPLVGHLRELKQRLIKSLLAVGVAFIFTYTWSEGLYNVLTKPLFAVLPADAKYIIFTGLGEPFFIYLEAGIAGAVIAASPFLLYQMWAFIAPGLHANERRWFISLLAGSFLLFWAGVLFAYFIVFPFAFRYLMGFSGPGLRPYISMGLYFSSSVKMLLAFGAIFQLPLLMLVVSSIGLISARTLALYWRYAVVLCFIIGAILTPPDVFSQILMSVPLVILYGLGVFLAFVFGKKKEEEAGTSGLKEGKSL